MVTKTYVFVLGMHQLCEHLSLLNNLHERNISIQDEKNKLMEEMNALKVTFIGFYHHHHFLIPI